MSRKGVTRRGAAPLVAVAVLLALSGLLRLGETGAASALEMTATPAVASEDAGASIAAGIAALRERSTELDRREAALEDRIVALRTVEETVAAQLASLREAEDRLRSLMTLADDLVDLTVDRFAGRLADESDRAVLRQTAHTVARKLLAGPVSYLKHPDRAPEAVDVIAGAFGVDDG